MPLQERRDMASNDPATATSKITASSPAINEALERLSAAHHALSDHDAKVVARRVAPNPELRFALDLERRCAQLRYDTAVNPI